MPHKNIPLHPQRRKNFVIPYLVAHGIQCVLILIGIPLKIYDISSQSGPTSEEPIIADIFGLGEYFKHLLYILNSIAFSFHLQRSKCICGCAFILCIRNYAMKITQCKKIRDIHLSRRSLARVSLTPTSIEYSECNANSMQSMTIYTLEENINRNKESCHKICRYFI